MTRSSQQFVHEQIFQSEPKPWLKKSFPLNGWTETIAGYQNEAHRLSCCICRNLKYQPEPYRWRLTVHFHREMSVLEIRQVWAAACKKLQRRGVVALWVREPTPNNRCHYHLIVTRPVAKEALADALEASLPDRKDVRWHKHIRKMRSQ